MNDQVIRLTHLIAEAEFQSPEKFADADETLASIAFDLREAQRERDEAREALAASRYWNEKVVARAEVAEEMAKRNACDWADVKARAEAAERELDRERRNLDKQTASMLSALAHEVGVRKTADAEVARLKPLADRLAYIASEYECSCETPGTSYDCESCTARSALGLFDPAPEICVCRHGIDVDDCGAWDCVNRVESEREEGT